MLQALFVNYERRIISAISDSEFINCYSIDAYYQKYHPKHSKMQFT